MYVSHIERDPISVGKRAIRRGTCNMLDVIGFLFDC